MLFADIFMPLSVPPVIVRLRMVTFSDVTFSTMYTALLPSIMVLAVPLPSMVTVLFTSTGEVNVSVVAFICIMSPVDALSIAAWSVDSTSGTYIVAALLSGITSIIPANRDAASNTITPILFILLFMVIPFLIKSLFIKVYR